jgi:hypothetical protein
MRHKKVLSSSFASLQVSVSFPFPDKRESVCCPDSERERDEERGGNSLTHFGSGVWKNQLLSPLQAVQSSSFFHPMPSSLLRDFLPVDKAWALTIVHFGDVVRIESKEVNTGSYDI